MTRCFLTYSLIAVFISFSVSAADFQTLALKARRFFDQKEWASASAMYSLMLDERPADSAIYGPAIVAAEAQADTAQAIALLDKSIDCHIPFDTIFQGVRSESFAIGRADIYEQFLLSAKSHAPWLTRSVDHALMRYYAFRCDGSRMVEYATIMLRGLPDSIDFLSILASGYLLDGQTSKAIDTYRHILTIDHDNYNALLYLGNYYFSQAGTSPQAQSAAREYLSRARAIRQAPYIDAMIHKLNTETSD